MLPVELADVEQITEEWLKQEGAKVGEQPLALIQGWPYTGFVRVSPNVEFPPHRGSISRNWDRYWDIRIFGASGETHAWRIYGRWKVRRCRFEDIKDKIERTYRLWGKPVNQENGWYRFEEDRRGLEFWAPFDKPEIKTWLLVDYDEGTDDATGLAGIVDFVIRPLEGRTDESQG
jgi:hypothetical protein